MHVPKLLLFWYINVENLKSISLNLVDLIPGKL